MLNDPLHNKAIDELVGRLHAAAESEVHVRDKVGDAVREFSLFKSHPSSSYDWVHEPQTRIWTPGQAFVQPDTSTGSVNLLVATARA